MKLPNPRVMLLGLVLASAALVCLSEASPSMRSRGWKKGSKQYQGQPDMNVCDIEQKDTPLFCHCDNNNLARAEQANCLVYKNLELKDPVWAYFNSQIYIKRLTFTVKSDGSITYVPTAVLRQLKVLNVVSFQHASFVRIPRQTFASLPTISTINLSKDGITGLDWHAFEMLTNLTELNLDDNQISDLNRDIFYELPRLERLYLNRNNVTMLRDSAFEHLPALIELELSNNRISRFTAQSFHKLDHLQRLDLHNNLIRQLDPGCFVTLPELQELDLDQNAIEHISSRALEGLRQLTKLRLADNKLVTLEPDSLLGAPHINLLNLGNNQLRTLTFDNIKPIITNFYNNASIFYLNGNRLVCDCQLTWIWGLRNETKNPKLREGLEELACLLDASYEPKFDSGEDITRALELHRSISYQPKIASVHNAPVEKSQYPEDGYEYDYEDSNFQYGRQVVSDGKTSFVRRLLELKPELLPCPSAREDAMASEQPSGGRDPGSSGSIFSFVSGSATGLRSTLGLLFAGQLMHLLALCSS